jgi:hypothetical protein
VQHREAIKGQLVIIFVLHIWGILYYIEDLI